MRTARNFALVVVTTAAVMAIAASSASAILATEITKADGKTHCPTLAAGGCKLHQEGEVTLFFHIFGFEGAEAKCHVEFRGTTDEDGGSQITAQAVTSGGHDIDCWDPTMQPCNGSLPWAGSAEKERRLNGTDYLQTHYDACIAPIELNGSTCTGEFITDTNDNGTTTETQSTSATDLRIGSSFCEITLSLSTEAEDVTDIFPAGEEPIHIRAV